MIFLSHLPTEVIIRLLSLLSPKELASCVRLSKRFLDIIRTSSILTYVLEASKAGLDGTYHLNRLDNSDYSPAELLADLRRREQGWSTFTWKKHFEIPIGKKYIHLEVCGPVFAGGYPRAAHDRAINAIDVYDFQNTKDNGFVTTLSLDMFIAGFSIDAGQDLLVLGEMCTPEDSFCNLHLRTLSTGLEYTHTNIKRSIISLPIPPASRWRMSYCSAVYIYGDNLLFLQFTRDSCDLKMINWKTAQTLTVYSGPGNYNCTMISQTEALLIGCGEAGVPELKYFSIDMDDFNDDSSDNEDDTSTEDDTTSESEEDETSAEDVSTSRESDWEDVPQNNTPFGPTDIVYTVDFDPNNEPLVAMFKSNNNPRGLDHVTFNLPFKNLPHAEQRTWDVGLIYSEVPFTPKPFSPFVKSSTIVYPPHSHLFGAKIQSLADDLSSNNERIHTFDIFIHLETLRKLNNTFFDKKKEVPWQDWGPAATRVFRNKYPAHWNRRSLRGYRVLTPDLPKFRTVNGKGRMDCVILDFNQKAWTDSTPGIVREPSEVVTQDKNKTKITSCLPYRKIVYKVSKAPWDKKINIFGIKLNDPYVMLGEDIVCFDLDSNGNGVTKALHIFKL